MARAAGVCVCARENASGNGSMKMLVFVPLTLACLFFSSQQETLSGLFISVGDVFSDFSRLTRYDAHTHTHTLSPKVGRCIWDGGSERTG